MGKVGRFVSDPKEGAYCQITLDSGEKIVVNHDKGGFKGGTLTIAQTKWMGLSGDTFYTCSLDAPEGKAVMGRLTKGIDPQSARATPLGAFVEYVKDCKDVAAAKSKCAALVVSSGGS